jgi:hypothetical protein
MMDFVIKAKNKQKIPIETYAQEICSYELFTLKRLIE